VTPIAGQFVKATSDPASKPAYWAQTIAFLHARDTPSYRVEAVDTAGHWGAFFLAEAQIPLARGGFRQDDFPQNKVLYDELGPAAYLHWLRGLGVRYVVLTTAPSDYSAKGEAALLRSGRSGLRPVYREPHVTIFSVPRPRPILTGRWPARVIGLTGTQVLVELSRPGRYRLVVRYSPYWHAENACLDRAPDGMTTIDTRRAGRLQLVFRVDAESALNAVVGRDGQVCESRLGPP
jgi:hypothetical protein